MGDRGGCEGVSLMGSCQDGELSRWGVVKMGSQEQYPMPGGGWGVSRTGLISALSTEKIKKEKIFQKSIDMKTCMCYNEYK